MTTPSVHLDAPHGQRPVDLTRPFDAPVEAVFEAHRDPEPVRQWLGPHGYPMVTQEWDLRSGGRWRYVHRNPQGHEFGFRGCFHSVRDDELAAQSFEYDGSPDHVSLDTLRFERLPDGGTLLRGHSVFLSVEDRDAMVASGMERGMREGDERLDARAARAGVVSDG